jgi:hypothetical protein
MNEERKTPTYYYQFCGPGHYYFQILNGNIVYDIQYSNVETRNIIWEKMDEYFFLSIKEINLNNTLYYSHSYPQITERQAIEIFNEIGQQIKRKDPNDKHNFLRRLGILHEVLGI